jgi:hypothetical protein
MNRLRSRPLIAAVTALGLVLLAPVLWYLASPLFITRAADDADSFAIHGTTLRTGTFGEIDTIHKGSGTAEIASLPDGQRVLRLRDFQVTNGPDLYVYLSGHPAPHTGSDVHDGGAELGRLRGNIGNQQYEIPADIELAGIRSAVIYCKAFSVVFSSAELRHG